MGVALTNQLANLDPNAVIRHYSKKLRRKAIANDIYVNLRGDNLIYQRGQQMNIPESFYTKVEAGVSAGSNSINVVMKMPINANILRGRAVALGTEVAPVIKSGLLWRNNYRFVVRAEPGYGEDKLDAQDYRLYQEHVNDLYPHAGSEEGLETRMAIVETFGWNLMAGSTLANCPASWNPNFYVIGCPMTQQPTYHPNGATYTNRIVTAIQTAAGGAAMNFRQTAGQMLTGNALDNICRWAFRRRLMPQTIEGRSAYVLTISQLAAQRFTDPTFVDSLGHRWTQVDRILNEKVQNWYGLIGKYQGPNATVYIAIDDRLPTLLPTGTAAPFGLTAGYVWPTDSDLRNLDNALVRDAMLLHGKGGLVNWEPEKMHLIQQDWDYRLRNGKGYAGVRGIQLLRFNNALLDPNQTGAAMEHWGSAVVVAGRSEP